MVNVSVAPVAQFCEDAGMTHYAGGWFSLRGCVDQHGEIHYYNVGFENDTWRIGDKNYVAKWSG